MFGSGGFFNGKQSLLFCEIRMRNEELDWEGVFVRIISKF